MRDRCCQFFFQNFKMVSHFKNSCSGLPFLIWSASHSSSTPASIVSSSSTISPYTTPLYSTPLYSITLASLLFLAHQAHSFVPQGLYTASSHVCNFLPHVSVQCAFFLLLELSLSIFLNRRLFLIFICKEYFFQPHLSLYNALMKNRLILGNIPKNTSIVISQKDLFDSRWCL